MGAESGSPRLLSALVGLPALTREALSHLLVDPQGIHVQVVPDPDHGESFGGPLTTAVGLREQIAQVASCGLWEQVALEPVRRGGRDLWRVQLWADPREREAWRRRVALAASSPRAGALLAAAGEFKLAQWRRDQALEGVRAAVRAGDGQGVSRSDLVRLAQVARSTVYAALEEPDERAAVEPLQGTSQMDLDWDADAAVSVSNGSSTPSDPATSTPTRPAPPRARRGGPGDLVRMPVGRHEPCVVCGTPARDWFGGVPVHTGQCLTTLRDQSDPEQGQARISPGHPESIAPAPQTGADSDGAQARTAKTPASGPQGAPAGASARPSKSKNSGRFTALAAAIDDGRVFLPGDQVEEWAGESLADAAMLAARYRLGHGGGKTLPFRGEVWIYPSTLQSLGLPADAGVDSLAQDAAVQRKERFGALMDTPAVAALRQAGWELVGTRIGARTVVTHEQHAPGGVVLVMPSWGYVAGVPLLDRGDEQVVAAEELVDRLQAFADHVGVPWQIAGGITGMALIDHTRPPRADIGEPLGRPAAVVRNAPGAFPPFLREQERIAARIVEANFSWWRPWDSLSEQEQALPYVHAYDHRSHFLNPWASTDLGVEGLIHLIGDEARWDGTEKPGYYLVEPWEWQEWSMPDPGLAGGFRVEDGLWVTSHTLRQLERISPGFTDSLTFVQAYRWQHTARYLEAAGKILRAARNEAPEPVANTVKLMYSMTTAKLASRELRANHHLFRPDWRDHIIGASRTGIVTALLDARERCGSVALVVDRDLIVFASAEPDPAKAWPGRPEKYAAKAGGWSCEGSAPLAAWGPQALNNRRRLWQYAQHMDLMRQLGIEAGLMDAGEGS